MEYRKNTVVLLKKNKYIWFIIFTITQRKLSYWLLKTANFQKETQWIDLRLRPHTGVG